MPQFDHSVAVKTSAEKVWAFLQDLLRDPLRYMPLVSSSDRLRWTAEGASSEIEVLGFVLREQVDIDEGEMRIRFTLKDSADFSGKRELSVTSEGAVSLHFLFEWTPLSLKAKSMDRGGVESLVKGALERWKAALESRAS